MICRGSEDKGMSRVKVFTSDRVALASCLWQSLNDGGRTCWAVSLVASNTASKLMAATQDPGGFQTAHCCQRRF